MENKKPILIFVYNADSGLFNSLTDLAHKLFSPQTYQCNLCALTYSTIGMRRDWKAFIENIEFPLLFLHRDEFYRQYKHTEADLPAVFVLEDDRVQVWISADEINGLPSIDALKALIIKRLRSLANSH